MQSVAGLIGMEIKHIEKIQGTPIVPLAVTAWKELLDRGLAANAILIDWEMNAFYAEQAGEIVGILVYKHYEHDHSLFVALGWVQPRQRGRGIYRALWEKAVEKAREKGCHVIDGITHRDNKAMHAVMDHLGRTPKWITYEFALEPV
jgi:GNAT superfamily N-acetyltransferase